VEGVVRMVMVPQQVLKGRLTFEDYQQLPDDQDYEIIEGVLYVAPRARPRHQIIAAELVMSLGQHVGEPGLGVVVPDADLIISARDTYVSPDIMVFLGERARAVPLDDWIRTIPDLVVEVLSPSSVRYDSTTKRQLYAELRVPHYWIVDPVAKGITECVLGPDGQYRDRVVSAPDPFRPALFPDLAIDLIRLFRPLADNLGR
jgi:Uma2 family endonuclease